jgi:hypothetical protein
MRPTTDNYVVLNRSPENWPEEELAPWVDSSVPPEQEGIFITEDPFLELQFFNEFKNGKWQWGVPTLGQCNGLSHGPLPKSNFARWRGLKQPFKD